MISVWAELKRRNVVRVAIAYAVVAWPAIEISTTTFPFLRLPEWTSTFVIVLLIIGFPFSVVFAWAYELTPEGLKISRLAGVIPTALDKPDPLSRKSINRSYEHRKRRRR